MRLPFLYNYPDFIKKVWKMKINSVNYGYNINNLKMQNQYTGNPNIERVSGDGHIKQYPDFSASAANFLPFKGGYSLDLAQTVKMLDGKMPPDIKEMAEVILEEGNPDNLTLIDIHKAKYGKINQMKTVSEIKKAYPEFKDIFSDNQVDCIKNSFMDDVKNDRLEWFDSETDLALQLMQMYWADGFSLNDLKEYSDGKNIDSTMNKFNIPKLDRQYAHVLKLSDKEYNKRFTAQMSERLKGAERKRDIKRYGVYIPRGPMPEEQKKAISEGLSKYWAEHPEKKEAASEKMQQYYKEYPKETERMKRAVTIAWGLKDAQKLRRKMSKFMGKEDISAEEFARMDIEGSSAEKMTLKDFWNKNPWAKTAWSAYLTKGWEKLKKLEEKEKLKAASGPKADFEVAIYPYSMVRDMYRWFKKNGYDLTKIGDMSVKVTYNDKPSPRLDEYTHNAASAYFEAHDENLRADIIQVGLFGALGEILTKYPITSNSTDDFKKEFCILLANAISENDKPKQLTTEEATNIYTACMVACIEKNDKDLINIFEKNLEDAYFKVTNKDIKTVKDMQNKAFLSLYLIKNYFDNLSVENSNQKPQKSFELKFSKPKEGEENFTVFEIYSPSLKEEMLQRLEADGIDTSGISKEAMGVFFDLNSLPSGPYGNERINKILSNYAAKNKDFADFVANMHLVTFLDTAAQLKEAGYEGEKGRVAQDIYRYVDEQICDSTVYTYMPRPLGARRLQSIYTNCVEYCHDKGFPEFAKKFEENLETSYHKIKQKDAYLVLSDILNNHYL